MIDAEIALNRRDTVRLRWLHACVGAELRLVDVSDVVYFQSDCKYTLVVTAEQELPIRMPIQALVERLDPDTFCQIHRATIVNLREIARLRRKGNGTLEVTLKRHQCKLVVSATFAPRFHQM